MATQDRSSTAPIIRESPLWRNDRRERRAIRELVPAWIISGIVHVTILGIFLIVGVPATDTSYGCCEEVTFQVDEVEERIPDLQVTNIGENPDMPVLQEDLAALVPSELPSDGLPPMVPPPTGATPRLARALEGELRVRSPKSLLEARSNPDMHGKLLESEGGNSASEAAVARALQWFARHQATDGRWSLHQFHVHGHCNCSAQSKSVQNDVAATAFALLAFLGTGQTHKTGADKGNLYAKVVERGLKYLVLNQNRQGEFHPNMYAHGLATIAICEAYALTSDPALRGPAQRAINYIVDAQSGEGGWRYAARQAGIDTSVTGWQVMALKSGQMAGLDVPTRTLKAAVQGLDSVATPDGGGYGYTGPGETPTLSAVGLLCRQYLGWGPRHPGLLAGVERLSRIGPAPNNLYYNYYATQVMHHMGGGPWEAWNPRMRDALVATQDRGDKNPHQHGSWAPAAGDSITGDHGGRIMATSLSVLTLEVYYRHLPLYRRDIGGDKALKD